MRNQLMQPDLSPVQVPAQMSSAISNGLGFASYEAGLSWYRKYSGGLSPTPAERGAIAGGAATLVMAVIQPLEVIMRRMQVQEHVASLFETCPPKSQNPGLPRSAQNQEMLLRCGQ